MGCSTTQYIHVTPRVFYGKSHKENISIHCSPEHPQDKNSFTYLFLKGTNRIDQFIFRRPFSYEACLWRKKEIGKVLASNGWLYVTGVERDPILENTRFEKDDKGFAPKYVAGQKRFSWFFDRVESNQDCHGYFEDSCKGRPLEYLGAGWVFQ